MVRALPPAGDGQLFKPTQRTKDDLKEIGIVGQNPAVSFGVCVRELEKRYIAHAIVNLSRQATEKNADMF